MSALGQQGDLGDLKIWGKDGLGFCIIKGLKESTGKNSQTTPQF